MSRRLFQLAIIAMSLAAASISALSQQSDTKPDNNSAAAPQLPKHYYRLNFVLREMDEGKLLNQRAFTQSIAVLPVHTGGPSPDWWNVRSGTRVPVSGAKDVNYLDVGVNLDVRAEELGDALQMLVTTEISSVGSETTVGTTAPAIRQVKARSALQAAVGKPTLVFAADDSARHRFELEVTPTRER
jgi:hypothetical protein